MHKKSGQDDSLEKCHACHLPLTDDDGWLPHTVRIYVEEADPAIIKHFIKSIKKKHKLLNSKKKETLRKRLHPRAKKVA